MNQAITAGVALAFALGGYAVGDRRRGVDSGTATAFLRDKCGLRPEAVREEKAPFETEDFGSLATISMVMNHDSNIEYFDTLTHLRFGLWPDPDKPRPSGQQLYERSEKMQDDAYSQMVEIAERAAKCGAAYGVVAASRP
jgi:hypothetical protein